jgi:6,7-dimethyl-8-ribityllumazine synthase
MASQLKNLNQVREADFSMDGKRIGLVTAEWNEDITFAMRDAAIAYLLEKGVSEDNLVMRQVPGSFELVFGAASLLEHSQVDGVIAIGCVIQGETPHFTFISQAVASALAGLNARHVKPVVFGVLTTDTHEQARERSGGKHGNKGVEAAATLLRMLAFGQSA